MKTPKRAFKRFLRAHSGTVGIMFALAAVPFMMAMGMAVDYARAVSVYNRMQAALDAGALAAAASGTLTDGERVAMAFATFEHNFRSNDTAELQVEPKIKIVNDSISMSARVDYPTAFMRVAGINTMDIGASVEVSLPEDKKAEIALVLDYSGSMKEVSGGKVKYIALREAAIKLVEDLTLNGKTADRVKFGLVPFSHHVHVTLPGDYVVGQKKGSTWSGCTQDRKYPYNTMDTTPDPDNDDTKWGWPQAPLHAAWGCAPYVPNNLVVKPITQNHEAVINQLKVMRPYQWTNISLGFEFGWHLLSPNSPFGGVVPYGDKETIKVLVLLTDGRQTEPAFGKNGSRTVANGERNLEILCENAKAKGVRVITLAFDLLHEDAGPATAQRLKDCSTDPSKDFFIAEDDDALANAFEQIKAQLAQDIFISK